MIADEIVAGNVRFVDSGGTKTLDDPNYGGDPGKTFKTWDYAIGKMTADNGDHIIILPGHAENIALTTTVDIDVAGLKIIGLGRGSNRPTFTQTATDAYVDAVAANLELRNLYFKGGVNSGTVAMLNIGAKNILIDACEFKNISALLHTDYFIQTSGAANVCDYLTVQNCLFNSQTTGDCNAAIWLEEVEDSVLIRGNIILGAYDDGGIFVAAAKVCTMLRIEDNIIENTETGDWAIEVASASTGFCINNRMYTNAYATMLDPGSLKCSGNVGSITTDQEAIPIPAPQVLAGPGSNYFTVATSFGSATWNTVASHEIATVTGLCRLRIIPECTTSVVGGTNADSGSLALGIKDNTTLSITATTATNLNAIDIWATSGTTHYQGFGDSGYVDIISNGDDVGYTIGTSALTAGVIEFHIWWEPLESGASVVAGGGGAL